MNIRLMDGVAQAALHPTTFEVPTAEEKANIKPGCFVKLGFLADDPTCEVGGERMWVHVTGDGVGELDNDPVFMQGLSLGDVVHFQPQNILAIMEPLD